MLDSKLFFLLTDVTKSGNIFEFLTRVFHGFKTFIDFQSPCSVRNCASMVGNEERVCNNSLRTWKANSLWPLKANKSIFPRKSWFTTLWNYFFAVSFCLLWQRCRNFEETKRKVELDLSSRIWCFFRCIKCRKKSLIFSIFPKKKLL